MSFIGSMTPTGPIALLVLKRSLGKHNLGALSLAAGAALAESGYALLAYLGVNFALSRHPIGMSALRIIVALMLIVIAVVCMFSSNKPKELKREYPGANFMLGLTIAGLNPSFFITWTGAITAMRGAGLLSNIHAAPAFAVGVIIGPVLWFWILIRVLAWNAEKISPRALIVIEKTLPIALLALAFFILIQAILP
jgi:threonine/homoserine/homoserine lactone efflux protein